MSLVLQSSGGGSVTIAEPTTASDFTQTLPAADGVTMVSGNMPAFSATNNANQAISNNTNTKIAFQTEQFDTANAFDNATNYRFQPSIAGYYQLNLTVSVGSSALITQLVANFYKNGSVTGARIIDVNPSASLTSNSWISLTGSSLIYLNGTDYIEAYAYVFGASGNIGYNSGFNICQFSGSLVRTA
jgi:hypothetical protein